ncbi:MAG: histidinol-phosphatase, partial [Chryseolinea sp.]
MWSNFHTHSDYCDGKGNIREYVRKAEQLNMMSLGFSSHAPLPFPNKWCMKPKSMDSYLSSISELQKENSSVEIYKGLEVDYIPNVISPNDFKDQLDYTVGSIHFVEQLPDGTRWEIDGQHNFFLEGFEKIFKSNIRDTVGRYFELTREMILKASPTIVGHLDKIKIQNIYSKLFSEDDTWYQREIKKTIDLIGESDCIIEVNTRGIYQKKCNTTYPGPWVLEYIYKRNIPITLSSDAHHSDDLINEFDNAAAMLAKILF